LRFAHTKDRDAVTASPPGARQVAPEVMYADPGLVSADLSVVATLKAMALASPRKRARLCAHPDPDAPSHEMLIVMSGESYVRPHRHFGKTETLTVFEGEADALIFRDDGALDCVLEMGAFGTDRTFFYRMPERVFHGLIFRTPWLVYLETTTGPFDPCRSEGAGWAPPETEPEAGHVFYAAIDPRKGR
jgi:cupin fold WbuC family metalloprotein